jgi:integrase
MMSQYRRSRPRKTPGEAARAAPTNPFLDERVPTFAEVIARARNDAGLTPDRRHEVVSALRGFARLMRQDPAAMPAMLSIYRQRFRRLTPAGTDLSAKRLANIRSGVLFCLRRYAPAPWHCALPEIGPDWEPLWDQLDMYQRCQLSRFIRWCSASGRAPETLTDDDITTFRRDLEEESFVKTPNGVAQNVCRMWNKISGARPDLGLPLLTVPRFRHGYVLPVTAFPESFQRDLRAFLARLGGEDPLEDDGPPRPLKPVSVRRRGFQVRQLASGLVRTGTPIEAIVCLATLVEPDRLRQSLRFFLKRAGGRTTTQISTFAFVARVIARYWTRSDADTLLRLKRIGEKVAIRQRGMTDKNRDRLRAFDDPRNRERLLYFAQDVITSLRTTDDGGVRVAIQARTAIAVALLLAAPIRLANLIALRLDVHLLRSRSATDAVWHLVLRGDETKTGQPIEHELGPETVTLLQEYLRRYRPRLAARDNDHLFPSGAGHMSTNGFSTMLSAMVLRRTGLEMNVHLFRHLAAKVVLEHTPGAYGIVQDILGHRDPMTTRNFYAGSETVAATRHYDGVIRAERERLRAGISRQ